jgi:hypothetical protein
VWDFRVPQPTEWQRIGDEIKAAFVHGADGFSKHALAALLG